MGKPQSLNDRKYAETDSRVYYHLRARGIDDRVTLAWAEGGSERWFRTLGGREGWWNPKTDELWFRGRNQEAADLLAECARWQCPGGRTRSLCGCVLFVRNECVGK